MSLASNRWTALVAATVIVMIVLTSSHAKANLKLPSSAAPLAGTTPAVRVNAGGGGETQPWKWLSDKAARPSRYTNAKASKSAANESQLPLRGIDSSVPADTPRSIFRSQRVDRNSGKQMRWTFPVEPGSYELWLYFIEPTKRKAGERVFDVIAEDRVILDSFDVFSEVGHRRGMATVTTVDADQTLGVRFRRERGRPTIAGIRLVKAASLPPPREGDEQSASPCLGTMVTPDDDLTDLIAAYPAGETFCLGRGVHRIEEAILPKSGQEFVGEQGAILSGARPLDSWTRQGNLWVAAGQTQESNPHGRCIEGISCRFNEDVFINGSLAKRVMNVADLSSGSFFFDYANDKIYIADDPSTDLIEAAIAPFAFKGRVGIDDVTIDGLVIERFANAAQKGAVYPNGGLAWVMKDNEVRFNHGTGLSSGTNGAIINNLVHHNGQKGLGGVGDNILIQGNVVGQNNTVGFAPGWEAGGAKFARTRGLVVRDNYVHGNHGNGLWSDVESIDTLYEGNRVTNNSGQGIMYEISYGAVIRNNVVKRNGFGRKGGNWLYGAGILIAHSPDVEVYGNTVSNNYNGIVGIQQDRGTGAYGEHRLMNLSVRHNLVRMARGKSGVGQTVGDKSLFTDSTIRFENNTYYVREPKSFAWRDATLNPPEWKSFGNDTRGIFRQY